MSASYVWVVWAGLLGTLGAWWISRNGRLDPLERRRLHRHATPRGGGAGIALAGVLAALVAAPGVGWSAAGLAAAALAGAWEDRYGLAARWRLLLHLLAAGCLVAATLPTAPLGLQVLVVVAVAGFINLVNFMDGANGLVALQALICGLALGPDPAAWMLAAAALGFLPLNFPRARVFLGDVGSYVLGAWIAWLWLRQWGDGNSSIGGLGMLLGLVPLWLDAGLTLARRILSGRRWYAAHREHLYQWAIRCGASHVQISMGYAALATLLWTWVWAVQAGGQGTLWHWALVLVPALGIAWQGTRIALWRRHRRQCRARRSSGGGP